MTDSQARRAAERYSPDKQLAIFSKTRFLGFIVLAIMVHALFLTVTSMPFIRDTWIDPEAAELRKKQEKDAMIAAQKGTVMMQAGRIGSSNVAAMVTAETNAAVRAETFAAGTNAAAAPATNANPFLKQIVEAMPQDGRPTDSKIIRQITDLPKTNEIPTEPFQDIPLRIEDTN